MSTTPPEQLRNLMLEALHHEMERIASSLNPDQFPRLSEMVSYHLGWDSPELGGGKQIRPLLTLLCCAASGGDWRGSLPAASAVELIHNFSLIHDDIEDGSHSRRGRATLWVQAGTAQSINTGDALFSLAHLALHRLPALGHAAHTTLKAHHLLDQACLRLTQGQHLDLLFEAQEHVPVSAYLLMIEGKTAALIAAAAELGSLLATDDPDRAEAYRAFGHHLGMAFQIQDDILGLWGSTRNMGKPTLDDLRSKKKTLPILLGLERSDPFLQLWKVPDPTEGELHEMITSLNQADIPVETQTYAEKHTAAALAALERAQPRGSAGTTLGWLSDQLLHREK